MVAEVRRIVTDAGHVAAFLDDAVRSLVAERNDARRMLAEAVEALEEIIVEIGGCIYSDPPCLPPDSDERTEDDETCAWCIARATLARLRPSSPEGER